MNATVDLNTLSVRRAKDRELLAQAIEEKAQSLGATCERLIDSPEDRMILIQVRGEGGLQVSIDLCGQSSTPDSHMLSWNIAYDSDSRLDINNFGGAVNPHHKRKATYFANSHEQLLEQLKRGLTLAKSGKAFLPQFTDYSEERFEARTVQFDLTQAHEEGWTLTYIEDDCIGLFKRDGSAAFSTHEQATLFVAEQAKNGSEYHQKTLMYLAENSPIEHQCVVHYAGLETVKPARPKP